MKKEFSYIARQVIVNENILIKTLKYVLIVNNWNNNSYIENEILEQNS